MYYTVIKHDGHLRLHKGNVENTSRRGVFSTFLECSECPECFIYGLETVVSVLFSNTRTCFSLRAVLKISCSLYSKQVHVFENKTQTNSPGNPFNIQSEFTDLQWLPTRPV